jgi:hypothetical protein
MIRPSHSIRTALAAALLVALGGAAFADAGTRTLRAPAPFDPSRMEMLTDYDLNVAFAEKMLGRKAAWLKGEMPRLKGPRYIDPVSDGCASAEVGHPEDCDLDRPLKAKGARQPKQAADAAAHAKPVQLHPAKPAAPAKMPPAVGLE